ncbi:hypothetical protein V491_05903 [Pseudogymnoascus sp. VKM F-3775]|nr:hypothetical protein V491_05903 [Pseudogymnoascus sp. VKM F-3775]
MPATDDISLFLTARMRQTIDELPITICNYKFTVKPTSSGQGKMANLSLRAVPKVYKTIVVGEKGVGKSAIVSQVGSTIFLPPLYYQPAPLPPQITSTLSEFKTNFPKFILNAFIEDYDPPICTDFRKQVLVDNHVALLDISDTIASGAGMEESLCAVWEHDVRASDAALLVYSITSRESFLRINALRDAMLAITAAGSEIRGASESQKVRPIQIGLVGNKSDQSIDREVSVEEGVKLAEALGCSFVETSAKTGYNVDKAFHDLARAVDIANEQKCGDQQSAGGGFRGKFGRFSRSLGFKKTKA